MLETVGIPDARSRIDSYPHEFSGGMRPARDDCDGSLVRTRASDCRRTNNSTGRYHPGSDSRANKEAKTGNRNQRHSNNS